MGFHTAMSLAAGAPLVLASGPFDSIAGLPLHPLVVHATVVLLPLAALGLIVMVLIPRTRPYLDWLTLGAMVVATGSAFAAKLSGEQLAERVGEPQRHADLGDLLPWFALALLVITVVWFVLQRADRRADRRRPATLVLGIVGALLAVGTIGWTIAVGHSGAEAAWGGVVQGPASDTGTSGTGATAPSESAAPSPSETAATYTLDDLAAHATPTDCWTAIDGNVYDLTAWIDQHPGGAQVIIGLCGTDGSAGFRQQHGTQTEPNAILGEYAIGALATP